MFLRKRKCGGLWRQGVNFMKITPKPKQIVIKENKFKYPTFFKYECNCGEDNCQDRSYTVLALNEENGYVIEAGKDSIVSVGDVRMFLFERSKNFKEIKNSVEFSNI